MNQELDNLWYDIEDASIIDSNSEREKELRKILNSLDHFGKSIHQDGDYWFIYGLAWYNMPLHVNDALEQALDAFKLSLSKDSEHIGSRLYLGHCQFDLKQYKEAFESFSRIKTGDLTPGWRRLKHEELILCCKLYINYDKVSEGELKKVVKLYLDADDIDRPAPEEFVQCITCLCANLDVKNRMHLKALVNECIIFIKKLEMDDLWPKELELMSEIAQSN